VFHDGKTVNYHTGQLTPKLRMLSYPITFRNICTQGQNTFHTHTLWTVATFHSCFVWLAYLEFNSFIECHASAAPWMRFSCNAWDLYMPCSFSLVSTAFLPVWQYNLQYLSKLEQNFGQTISQKPQTCIWDKQLYNPCEKQLQGDYRALNYERFHILAHYLLWKVAGCLREASWTRWYTNLNSCFMYLVITSLSSRTFWCSQAKWR